MIVDARQGGHLEQKTRRLVVKSSRRDLAEWFLELCIDLPEASDDVTFVSGVNG